MRRDGEWRKKTSKLHHNKRQREAKKSLFRLLIFRIITIASLGSKARGERARQPKRSEREPAYCRHSLPFRLIKNKAKIIMR